MKNVFDKSKKILVTGGAGFIGGALIRRLLLDSSCEIFNLDKIGYASDLTGINTILSKQNSESKNRYKLIKMNLIDQKKLNDLIFAIKPDLIFHLAAETHVDRSIDYPKEFLNSNIIGTYNLLNVVRDFLEESSIKKKDSFRFHHISTDEVFGSLGEEGFFTELSQYDPRSPYSASKAASDHLVNAWHHTYGLPVITTNCSNNFGPWQFPEKLLPLIINKALTKNIIPMYGDGLQRRDWLFIDDHIDAILLAVTKGEIGQKFCIGGGEEKTNKEFILEVCHLVDQIMEFNCRSSKLIESVEDRPGHDFRYSIDSSLAKKQLGWKPKNNFKEALKKTVQWYINNQKWCNNVLSKGNYNSDRLGIFKN